MVDEVAFYARLHHLTPKYFASLIKAETGIRSTEWITNYVIIQAKMLLDSHKEMTVQQISYHLGSPNRLPSAVSSRPIRA